MWEHGVGEIVEAVGVLGRERAARRELETGQVARDRDEGRTAGRIVDADEDHRVGAEPPPARARIAAEQQDVGDRRWIDGLLLAARRATDRRRRTRSPPSSAPGWHAATATTPAPPSPARSAWRRPCVRRSRSYAGTRAPPRRPPAVESSTIAHPTTVTAVRNRGSSASATMSSRLANTHAASTIGTATPMVNSSTPSNGTRRIVGQPRQHDRRRHLNAR